MRCTLIIFFFYVFGSVLFAQIKQPFRFEIPLTEDDYDFEVLGLQDESLLIFRKKRITTDDSQAWEFMKLDSTLKPVWNKTFYINKQFVYARNTSSSGHAYLLFINHKEGLNLELVDINSKDGTATHQTIKNIIPFSLTHFEAATHGVFVGGLYNYRPLVIYYNFEKQRPTILPGFYHERSELVQLKVNDDQTTEVILSSQSYRYRNKTILHVKTFDEEGNLIKDAILEDHNDKNSLLFGRSCFQENGIQIVAGTYASRKSEYSRGLFVSSVDQQGRYNINFYNYADMDNFFSYMKAKREDRVKARIERKKIKDKKLRFNYRLMVHEIIENNGQYILLGEAFYPKYDHPTGADIAGFGTGASRGTEVIFDGYRYTHAVVASFDASGKLLWDNSFEINDLKTFDLERFVHASIQDNKIVLLYVYDNQIRSKIIKNSEVLEGKNYNEIALKYDDDELLEEDISELRSWYNNYFYVYGTQQIKNLKDDKVQLARSVFYINKVIYE